MTDYALISSNHKSIPIENLRAFKRGGHADGWVVPSDSMLIADVVSDLPDTPLNAFDYVGASGHTVTIDTGEAMVSASPIARDTQTEITLEATTNNQVVYAGFQPASLDGVVIGLDGDFTGVAQRIPIWSFDTNSTTVDGSEDLRKQDEYVNVQNTRYETSDGTGTAVDSAERVGDIPASDIAQTDQPETFNDTVTINDPNGDIGLHVKGSNEVDSNVVIIDGDADSSQDDDLLKIRAHVDPVSNEVTDSDTGFLVRGENTGQVNVGINTQFPTAPLDVAGNAEIGGNLNMTGNQIDNVTSFIMEENGDGMRFAIHEERFYMAPIRTTEDTPRYGDELTYHAGDHTWTFESPFQLPTMGSRPSSPRVGTIIYRTDKD